MNLSWMLTLALLSSPGADQSQDRQVRAATMTVDVAGAELQQLKDRVLRLEMELAALARETQAGPALPGLTTD